MKGVRAPVGHIARIDPEADPGGHCYWFRNQYDGAFNEEGELFTYDADMEGDLNTLGIVPRELTMLSEQTSGVGLDRPNLPIIFGIASVQL